jgi:hypothetical protein
LVEQLVVAAEHNDDLACFETRIDRAFFGEGEPKGFDIRVGADDGTWLEWGGALYDPRVCPLAPLSFEE